MYGREIDEEQYTFGVSGKLIMNALVMYDHQTRTLWSQFLRRAVEGPLAGVELDVVPVTQTTWASWRGMHPDTVVLDKQGGYRWDTYRRYYGDGRAGVLGETTRDDRLGGKELVLGLDFHGNTKAYPLAVLEARPVVNDSFAGRGVLVFFDSRTRTAIAYERSVNGETLTFRTAGKPAGINTVLVDEETGSRWLAFTGRAIEGPLKGETLSRALSHLSFWFAWTDWYPNTEIYTG